MRFTAAFLVTLLVGTFILTGCGGSKRTVTTADGSVTVTEENKNGSVTIESKDGDSKATASTEKRPITEAELGVPVYPGATGEMTSTYEGSEEGKSQTMRQHLLTTPDSFDDVVAFYKSKLKDVKSQSVTTVPEGKIAFFHLEAPDGHVTITINEARDKKVTQVHVIKTTGS
ncbi:MAG: hypothetical protein HRF45_03890 [Fimbriimonadia bacterium]|jgi:hypothetical protein